MAAKIHPAPIFFDGDEYWTLENESSRSWRLFFAPLIDHTMKKYVGSIAAATTLSPPFVELYQQEYQLDTEIMLCVPGYVEVPVRPTNADHIILIHHGAARRNRYLETMIEALGRLDSRFRLVFMLVGGTAGRIPGYLDTLRAMPSRSPPGGSSFAPLSIHLKSCAPSPMAILDCASFQAQPLPIE